MSAQSLDTIVICETLKKISEDIKESKRVQEIEKTNRTAINAEKDIQIKAIEEKGETIRTGIRENTNYSINQGKQYADITIEAIKYGDKEIANKALEKMEEESKNYYSIQKESLRALTTGDRVKIGRGDKYYD